MPTVHVAVVGINRSLSHTHSSITREILRPLESSRAFRARYSLTLITPPGGIITNPHSGEVGEVETAIPEPFATWPRTCVTAISPEAGDGEPPLPADSFCESWQDHELLFTHLKTFLHALDTSHKNHVAPHSPDLVIFIRPDIAIEGRLWLRTRLWATFLRSRNKKPIVYALSWGRHRGLNDRFAIMSASAAQPYFTRGNIVDRFFTGGARLNSERFLRHSLSGATVSSSIYTPMPRVRLGGVYEAKDTKIMSDSALARRLDIARARLAKQARRLTKTLRND